MAPPDKNLFFAKLIISLALFLGLTNCGNLPPRNDLRYSYVDRTNANSSATTSTTKARLQKKSKNRVVKSPNKVQRLLQVQYEEWKGVRYRLGGASKRGIDCSAFVRTVMKNGLSVSLPRTTEQQAAIGKKISKTQLRVGDLVFFKTGIFGKRHVGIYMGDQNFLHASTSKGVMLSKLNSTYWRSHYWQSRRVMN